MKLKGRNPFRLKLETRTCLDVSEVTTKQERAASAKGGGLLFWSDDVLTEAIDLVHHLQEMVKQGAREDENPWRNLYYHGYECLAGAKIYLRHQLLDKHWMQNNLH